MIILLWKAICCLVGIGLLSTALYLICSAMSFKEARKTLAGLMALSFSLAIIFGLIFVAACCIQTAFQVKA